MGGSSFKIQAGLANSRDTNTKIKVLLPVFYLVNVNFSISILIFGGRLKDNTTNSF